MHKFEMGDIMAKKEVTVTVKSQEENSSYKIKSIIEDGIIKYKENNGTLVKFDYSKKTLVRENDELKMDYVFRQNEKTEGTIRIKELNKVIKVPIETKKLERKNNNIEIEFYVSDNEFLYKIEEVL